MEYGHKYEELPVEPGFKAPDFRLKDENGQFVSLEDLICRQSLVLVFIRAADDAHTGEQLDYLKDSYERIKYHCADVIAVSPGSETFNRELAKKHRLPFHILCDADCRVLKRYQIFNEYDKLEGPCIFILNCAGMITYMYNGKNPEDIVSMADIIHTLHDMQAS
jgi:thioredoxin-dependent peroxiredoxin